jgi:hypothetical protein
MEKDLIEELNKHVEDSHKLKQDILAHMDYHMFVAKIREMDSAIDILDMILYIFNKTFDDLIITDEHELIDIIYSKMDWLG